MTKFAKPADSAGRVAVTATKAGLLSGAASFALIAGAGPAWAQAAIATDPFAIQGQALEEIVVTGSLIRGAQVVGAPVVSVGLDQFKQQAAPTISDVLRKVPNMEVMAGAHQGASGTNLARAMRANIHRQGGARTLVMVDSMRIPMAGYSYDGYDPSIAPAIGLQRVDVLATGASAVYGSDAIAGVVNLILRRRYEGAMTMAMHQFIDGSSGKWQLSHLMGHRWATGDVTIALNAEFEGALPSRERDFVTWDFTPWGLDNRRPLASSIPGTISFGTTAGGANAQLPSNAVNPIGFSGSGCTNCLMVPAGQNGVGLTWASLLANPMVPQTATNPGRSNIVDPHRFAQYVGETRRYQGSITFDQRLTDTVEFFASGFFNSRWSPIRDTPVVNPWNAGALSNFLVPRVNPYYPVGTPANTTIRSQYSFALELNQKLTTKETTLHGDLGFNINLPREWLGKVFYNWNREKNDVQVLNTANANNIRAALGTIAADPSGQLAPFVVGDTQRFITAADVAENPGLSVYPLGTRVRMIPTSQVPYLNLFCDPQAFQCNDQRSLDFIKAHWKDNVRYDLQQIGGQADGPLFDLPGGQVRAAVGGSYVWEEVQKDINRNNSLASAEINKPATEILGRNYWSVFGQLNLPLFSEANAMPLMEELNVEFSARHDKYSDFGSTTNPRVSVDWAPVKPLLLRGSWGKSFAAPAFFYLGSFAASSISATNTAAGAPNNTLPLCGAGATTANPGSAAAAILGAIGAANCTQAAITAALAALPPGHPYAGMTAAQILNPGELGQGGGAANAYGTWRPAGGSLGPERATNWSLGFQFRPTEGILDGLNIQATYWHIQIRDFLGSPPTNLARVNDPDQRQYYIVRGADATNPVATFDAALSQMLTSPFIAGNISQFTNSISLLRDGMNRNLFRQRVDGVDFAITYVRDMGELGRWNAGVSGTRYISSKTRTLESDVPIDDYDGQPSVYGVSGNVNTPLTNARYALGWVSPGRQLDINLFMNYRSHYFNTGAQPPTATLANQLGVPTASLTGDALTQAQQNAMFVKPWYTFDISIGYNLGDGAFSPLLRDTEIRFTVDNLFNKDPPFFYRTANGGKGPVAFDPTQFSPMGRIIALQVIKNMPIRFTPTDASASVSVIGAPLLTDRRN